MERMNEKITAKRDAIAAKEDELADANRGVRKIIVSNMVLFLTILTAEV